MSGSEAAEVSRLAMAAHLVRCAIVGTISPKRDPLYKRGLDAWASSAEFRTQVADVAEGFAVNIADADHLGAIAVALPGSPFAPSAAAIHSYYRNGSTTKYSTLSPSEARVGLVAALAATAMIAFPDESALDRAGTGSANVYAKEVRQKIESMAQAAKARWETGSEAAGEHEGSSRRRFWQYVIDCADIRTTRKGLVSQYTLAWHVEKAFEYLRDHGHADLRAPSAENDEGLHIRPKDRFRKLVRYHSASEAHAAIRDAMSLATSCQPEN
jgi:hypothetical protein